MGYTAQQFIDKIKPYVIEDMKKNNVLASLTVAQGIIESNKGNSGLTTKANNLFGIKGRFNNQYVAMTTKEYVNSQYITVVAEFKKYPSWAESINDHSEFLKKYKRYASIIGETDYKKACEKMGKSGYATSPIYGSTLLKTCETYALYNIDKEVLGQTITTTTATAKNEIPIEQYPTLRYGATGLWVVLMQQKLNAKGFKCDVDGIFKTQTRTALIAFQGMNSLTKDSICGQKTWAKLCS